MDVISGAPVAIVKMCFSGRMAVMGKENGGDTEQAYVLGEFVATVPAPVCQSVSVLCFM